MWMAHGDLNQRYGSDRRRVTSTLTIYARGGYDNAKGSIRKIVELKNIII